MRMSDAEKAGKEFAKLVRILDVLRGENGCPWDKEQDEKSIVDYFLEEVYEVVDAIYDSNSRSVAEELGDVLMEIVFLSRIFAEKDKFKISEVVAGINHKMVRRHPHVFGPKKINSPEKISAVWRKQKNIEKKRKSLYEGLSKSTPALLSSLQIGLKASVYGFDWDSATNTLKQVKEEILELEKALESGKKEDVLEEIGDILFTLANVSRHLGINPEIALRRANDKFIKRFQYIEQRLGESGKKIDEASIQEMDELWEESKMK
jgi:MazG family protein